MNNSLLNQVPETLYQATSCHRPDLVSLNLFQAVEVAHWDTMSVQVSLLRDMKKKTHRIWPELHQEILHRLHLDVFETDLSDKLHIFSVVLRTLRP